MKNVFKKMSYSLSMSLMLIGCATYGMEQPNNRPMTIKQKSQIVVGALIAGATGAYVYTIVNADADAANALVAGGLYAAYGAALTRAHQLGFTGWVIRRINSLIRNNPYLLIS